MKSHDTGRLSHGSRNSSALRSCPRAALSAQLRSSVAVFVMVACTVARGELTTVEEPTDEGVVNVYQMTVTPAPEPEPALKHRLVLRETEYKPGNAATHYLRALAENGFGVAKVNEEEFGSEQYYSWQSLDTPLAELPMDSVRTAAARFDRTVDSFISVASERRDCDWGHNIEEFQGPDLFAFLLPDIQQMRAFSRMLALRTRVAIADGKYDEAIDCIRMNYRLGVNTARSPFLVSVLVGIAEAGMANQGVIELIAARDSPNLYWALAELPSPLVSVRDATRMELSTLPRVFPVMLEAENGEHSPEEWARLLASSWFDLEGFTDTRLRVPREARQAALAGMSLFIYPGAKQRLLESGFEAEQVEQMPVGQVIALDALQEFRRVADEMEKSLYVPHASRRDLDRYDPIDARGASAMTQGFGYMFAELLLPAANAARHAEFRLAWQLAGLKVIEAIRMHAAETGKLPASLSAIACVPVPENPSTGEPFEYEPDGDTAVLTLPFSDGHPGVAWRFEIKLDK